MRDNIFRDSMERLGKNFGVRGQMLEDRIEILWQEFSAVPDPIFIGACRIIMESDDRFPNIRRFKECMGSLASASNERNPVTPCKLCEGTGFFSTQKTKKEDGKVTYSGYVFRCTCANGAYHAKRVPLWDKKWEARGHVPFAECEIIWEMEKEQNRPVRPSTLPPLEENRQFLESLEKIKKMILRGKENGVSGGL